MMAEAWRDGGLQREREVRKQIQGTRDERNRRMWAEMEARS